MEGPDLKITNVQPDDEGVYTCEIITKLDVAEARGTLTLWGKTTDHIWPQTDKCPNPVNNRPKIIL